MKNKAFSFILSIFLVFGNLSGMNHSKLSKIRHALKSFRLKFDQNLLRKNRQSQEKQSLIINDNKPDYGGVSFDTAGCQFLSQYVPGYPGTNKEHLTGDLLLKLVSIYSEKPVLQKYLQKLITLDLSGTYVNVADMNTIFTHGINIMTLDLNNCDKLNLWNRLIPSWPSQLHELDLSFTSVDAEMLNKIFKDCLMLKKLKLRSCPKIQWDNVNWTKTLTKLDLTLKSKEPDCLSSTITTILKSNSNLTILKLYTRDSIYDAIPWPNTLKKLALSCENVTSSMLNAIFESCKRLTNLKLSSCSMVNWKEVKNVTKLKKLSLVGDCLNTDDLNAFLKKCPNIKKLTLSLQGVNWQSITLPRTVTCLNVASTSITIPEINQLLNKNKKIKRLDVSNCQNISPKYVGYLRNNGITVVFDPILQIFSQ